MTVTVTPGMTPFFWSTTLPRTSARPLLAESGGAEANTNVRDTTTQATVRALMGSSTNRAERNAR